MVGIAESGFVATGNVTVCGPEMSQIRTSSQPMNIRLTSTEDVDHVTDDVIRDSIPENDLLPKTSYLLSMDELLDGQRDR